MISVTVERDGQERIHAFTANNHGASHVCAAVSLLVLNTVNSIEKFADADFSCEYQEDGGYITFRLTGEPGHDAGLLLEAMMLGLYSVRDNYPGEIEILEKEVNL